MSGVRYAPGEAWAVVAAGRCVVVRADAAPGLIDALHRALTDQADLARIIDVFTGAYGPSLYALPSFAAVFPEATGVRVAVRGDVTVLADAPHGAHEFSGVGVTTWSERVIADADRVQVRVGPGAEPAYPLADGAAQVSAVALGQDAAPAPATAPAEPATAVPEPANPVPLTPAPVAEVPVAEVPVAEVPVASLPTPEPEPASLDTLLPAATTDLPTGMITSVPTSAASTPSATTTSYDELWGATVMRSVEEAAVRVDEPEASAAPEASAEPAAASPAPGGGDHDGQTVTLAQLRALRGAAATSDPAAEEPHPPLARPRPSAPGRLSLSDGKSVLLDRTVIIGRRPRSTRVAGTDLPHLVPVDSPQQDISRSHVEFRVEGDSIIVTDLHTTNGTLLVRTGAAPTRLHPGEATVVVVGDAIDLGDGVIVTVEAMA